MRDSFNGANQPTVWCLMQRQAPDGNAERTVIRCDDMGGAGPGWFPVASNLTFAAASAMRDGFNAGNPATVWCVIGNGGLRSVIRCDNIGGAGPGWIPLSTNLTFAAASGRAFGTPSPGAPSISPQSNPPATGAGNGSPGTPGTPGSFTMPLVPAFQTAADGTVGCRDASDPYAPTKLPLCDSMSNQVFIPPTPGTAPIGSAGVVTTSQPRAAVSTAAASGTNAGGYWPPGSMTNTGMPAIAGAVRRLTDQDQPSPRVLTRPPTRAVTGRQALWGTRARRRPPAPTPSNNSRSNLAASCDQLGHERG